MKKLSWLSLLIASIPYLSQAQDQLKGAYTIRLNISQLKNKPKEVYLERDCPMSEKATIQTVRVNGDFVIFKGKIDNPALMHIETEPGNGVLFLYLEPAALKINVGPSLTDYTIAGSSLQKEYELIRAEERASGEKQKPIGIELDKADLQKDTDKIYRELAKIEQIKEGLSDYYAAYCRAHAASSPLSIYALDQYFRNGRGYELYIPLNEQKLMTSDSLYHLLALKFRKLPAVQILKSQIDQAKTIAIGSIAPDFTEPDTSGKPIALSSLRGKYVLIDFWGSWCGDCRGQFPDLIKVYDKFKDRNFEILAVSWDWASQKKDPKKEWQKAIQQDHTPWVQVSDLQYKNAAVVLYNIEVVPMNFLIDPKGIIIGHDLSPDALKKKLGDLLL